MTPNTVNYVDITNESVITGVDPTVHAINFWNNLFEKYSYVVSTKSRKTTNDEL